MKSRSAITTNNNFQPDARHKAAPTTAISPMTIETNTTLNRVSPLSGLSNARPP